MSKFTNIPHIFEIESQQDREYFTLGYNYSAPNPIIRAGSQVAQLAFIYLLINTTGQLASQLSSTTYILQIATQSHKGLASWLKASARNLKATSNIPWQFETRFYSKHKTLNFKDQVLPNWYNFCISRPRRRDKIVIENDHI